MEANKVTIEELKLQRSTTKGSITRLKNYVEIKSDVLTSTELECRLGILEAYFKQLLIYQTQLERLVPTDNSRAELEDLYISAKSKIMSLLGTGTNLSANDTTLAIPHHSANHLPKIKLPKFTGHYAEYKNFIHLFITLVDKDPSLSKIEKFNHLLSCLSDQALSTVKTLQVTEDNYPKALERLKERYDNNTMIFLEYISSLLELPNVPKASSVHLRSLVDNTTSLFNSLQSLGDFENICNAIIIYISLSKVDTETRSKWDESMDYKKLSTWKECSDVLSKRCQYLEVRDRKHLPVESTQRVPIKPRPSCSNQRFPTSLTISQPSCLFCEDSSHSITRCPKFIKLSTMDRFASVKKLGLCLNCLGKGHGVSSCPSSLRCKNCKFPHNTLLHRPQRWEGVAPRGGEPNLATLNTALENAATTQVILATALVLVQDSTGGFQIGRVLLDSGSQVNFINESFAKSLNLQRQRTHIGIIGIGSTKTNINSQTQTTIRSRFSSFELSLEFLVAPSITVYQPESELSVRNWNLPRNINLADECFFQPSRTDLLLGAEAFFDLLQVGQIKLGQNLPSLQKTSLGWIVSGKVRNLPSLKTSCGLGLKQDTLEQFVEKFWELEEVQGSDSKWTEEQEDCEKHFMKNIEVLDTGRLMVQLPFKKDPSCLGLSYDIAFKRFLALERRLSKNPALKSQYQSFLEEYQSLGHISLVLEPNLEEPHYYLPHQCVIRPESVSTKLRVVFDASCRTSSHVSLNEILMVGPTVQNDLISILLRFRLHTYALTADIVKMYRQVLVHPAHRKFQLILWRASEQTPFKTYQLNTVTYGTSSAPFLAIRCLQYLEAKNKDRFILGSQTLQSDFYVDDMLTGADSLETLRNLKEEVVNILQPAGFELSKWNSNCAGIFEDNNELSSKEIHLNDCNLTSTLGIVWNPVSDEFNFSYKPTQTYSKFTKRTILSLSSSLFDPMGLVSPIIIKAKIILQKLWIKKLDWDASIPRSIETEWRQLMVDLHSMQNLSLHRHTLIPDRKSFQVHGFADASMDAYGCCIYLRSTDTSGLVRCRLLVAKSRVAPARKKQLPLLELCAAHLLSKLWNKVKNIFSCSPSEVYFWTNSSIVLHWVSTHSSKLSTFVGNRVAEIQDNTKLVHWKHVPTLQNPADIVSRGCTVNELKSSIWFEGPNFLLKQEVEWPSIVEIQLSPEEVTLEKKKTVLSCLKPESNYLIEVIERFSSYTKLLRVFGYILRFGKKRPKQVAETEGTPEQVLETKNLEVADLENALHCIVYVVQNNSFEQQIAEINHNQNLKGSIKWLNPFVEERNGLPLLRVRGRLKHANIPEECKHPLLLPKNSHFAEIMVRHLHLSNYHAGPKALVALVRMRFWIVNARELARRIVKNCPHCVRYRPKLLQQIMGNLPLERLTASRPFLCCGVDFCGPINTHYKIRGKVPYKTYVAVFVCFSSKAVHLEAVSDLSSDAFIAALKRMIGRRGFPKDIHCDNATNFVGAQTLLNELRKMMFKTSFRDSIFNFCTNANINFHFIPPRAPHFGGIWESAVKVAKGHLYRSLCGAKLTFEELTTALVEIEAVMNSRPITPMSSDPSDLEALTPAHFLIGSSLKAIPEPADEVANISYIHRWRRIHAVKTHFWNRWSTEYINELQNRTMWASPSPNITIDSLVIIHEDNVPPQKWIMGRILNVIKGEDGKVRVADVKTTRGIIRRPIRKLAAIPC